MTVQTDPVLAEIDALRTRQLAIGERIAFLKRLRSRPVVVPVLVYDRYHSRYEKPMTLPDDDRDPLEVAYRDLEWQSEEGNCYAIGVSVNGVLIEQDELQERFGRPY